MCAICFGVLRSSSEGLPLVVLTLVPGLSTLVPGTHVNFFCLNDYHSDWPCLNYDLLLKCRTQSKKWF
jgi:hypothetical protein